MDPPPPLAFCLLLFSGWINRQQQAPTDYLREENPSNLPARDDNDRAQIRTAPGITATVAKITSTTSTVFIRQFLRCSPPQRRFPRQYTLFLSARRES